MWFQPRCDPTDPLYKHASALQLNQSSDIEEGKSERMRGGRGSAVVTLVALFFVLIIQLETANAATYTVGGPGGWGLNSNTWPKGKKFRAGDVLVFNYDATMHNVVAVNGNGYKSCNAPAGAKVLSTGKDQVRLARGLNYFICGNPGHCQSGMKLAINAV